MRDQEQLESGKQNKGVSKFKVSLGSKVRSRPEPSNPGLARGLVLKDEGKMGEGEKGRNK